MLIKSGARVDRLAIGLGAVGLASVASLALFFVKGEPFGTINDLGNGAVGVASALLALELRRQGRGARFRTTAVATSAATLGAGITVVGSALVISKMTGFLLAGQVSNVGFALIGLWLMALNRSMKGDPRLPKRLSTLGVAAGATMGVGLASAPGIAMGIDNVDTAPGWIWFGMLGWIGTFFLYPAWSIWLGRVLARHQHARVPDGRFSV